MANDSSSSEIEVVAPQVSLEGNSRNEANRETRILSPSERRSGTPQPSLVGAKIGRYEITAWCGQGGYGVVYRAHDSQSGRDVAIKVLRDDLRDAIAHRAAFEKEAATAKRLSHANLVQVYSLEHDDERRPFIVEQFVDGGSLFEWAQAAPRTADEVVAMMIPVAEAVAYLHRSRLFHRDLKPNNILLDRTGNAYVSDFGLAISETELAVREGEVAGTFGYMAPEQIRGRTKRVDGRTDIWSLGVILYELLTGRLPFGGVSRPSTSAEYYAILSEAIEENDPEPLRTFAPQVSRELEDICLRCLEKEKRHRFKTGDDLAESLRRFRDRKGSAGDEGAFLPPVSSVSAIVPKGLRSFDRNDEAFFLDLLPGPRDRDDLPLCVSFWKERLGTSPADGRLDVCVIYGPSGSGKSSLIKAGVVPQLGDDVRVVSIECNAHDTESRLAAALRRVVAGADPSLAPDIPLTALCKRLQQGSLEAHKIVLVLDQFEQWLHSHPQPGGTELVQALECCNGVTLQALLLVRDDFWMPLSRFTDELSISLREGENCAAVDLFDRAHARKVLMLFGRAYGRLPAREAEFSQEQTAFLNRAVDELAEHDRVICVRLSLFADLMRSRPWTIAELEAVGGARGVGVKFLEETFGPQAPVIYRTQRAAAQRVLAALLPPGGSELRGQMRTVEQLRASAELDERSFQSLLRLLDEDLKLITPTTPEGGTEDGNVHAVRRAAAQYYQLTHDYLVPALGQWLTTELRRSRRGQAVLRLRERSEDWNRRPEPRRLPTVAEWLAINMLVSRGTWTADERRMMGAANRRVGFWAAAAVVFAAIVSIVAREWGEKNRGRELRDRVVNFETSHVPAVLADVAARPRWVRPLLERAYRDEFNRAENNASPDDSQKFRRRLHLSLALSPWDDSKFAYVLDHLSEVDPADLPAVIEMTQPLKRAAAEMAWPRLQKLVDGQAKPEEGQTLAAASLLARLAADDERWQSVAAVVAKQLVAARATHFSTWLAHLGQVARHLRGPLLATYQSHAATGGERAQLLEALARYAVDEPAMLVTAVEAAGASELPILRDASRHLGNEVSALASRRIGELSAKKPPVASTTVAALTETASSFERCGGFLDNEAGYVTSLPLEKFAAVAALLEKEGYRLECYRPYAQSDAHFVAATWRRDSRKYQLLSGLTAAELTEKNDAAAKEGMEIRDVARESPDRWSALWLAVKGDEAAIRFYVDVPYQVHAMRLEAWPKDGFSMERYDIHAPPNSAPLTTAIWTKQVQETDEEADVSVVTRAARTYGDLHPGLAQNDLRLEFVNPQVHDRLAIYKRAISNLQDAAKEKPGTAKTNAEFTAARLQMNGGEFEAALTIFDRLFSPTSSPLAESRAMNLLLMGRLEDAAKEIARFESVRTPRDPKIKKGIHEQMLMVLALRRGDVPLAQEKLQEIEGLWAAKDTASLELLNSRALFVRFHPQPESEEVAAVRLRAIQSLREQLARRETRLPEELIEHVHFDGLRNDPAFAALLHELKLDRRLIAVFSNRPEVVTRQLIGLRPAEHDSAARDLRNGGYLPRIVSAAATTSGDDLEIGSVWEKPATSFAESQILARKIVNLALVTAALGEIGLLKSVMADVYGMEARSLSIEGAPGVMPVAAAITLLREADSDLARRNVLRLLGSYEATTTSDDQRQVVDERTLRPFAAGGVQMAATWARRRWNLPDASAVSTSPRSKDQQQWYRNSHGHTMIVLDLREPALMGSASNDPDRVANSERQHWVQVGRTVAFASTETTVRQFEEFLADAKVKTFYANKEFKSSKQLYAPSPDCPQISVRWYDAARYCQWLSESEGLPASEWCFPRIWDVEDGAALDLPANILSRRGYRLPTEAEMELACRGGSSDSRPFGNSAALLPAYAWFSNNARGRTHEVGLLKPNDFGLFDVLGNVNEWCLDASGAYRTPIGPMDDDEIDIVVKPEASRILRSGSFSVAAKELRSANRTRALPARENPYTVGFRIVRTEATSDRGN